VAKTFDIDSTLTIDLRASLDDLYESQVAHAYKGDTVIKVRPSRERKARMGRPWYEDDKKMQFYAEGEDDDNYGGEDYSEDRMYEAFLKSEHLRYEDFVECICSDSFSEDRAAERGSAAEGAKATFLNEKQRDFQTIEKSYPQTEPAEELATAPRKTGSNNSGSTHGAQDDDASDHAAVGTAPLLKCPKCEVAFATQLELDNHVMGSNAACGQACGDQTTLGAYILAAHSVDQDLKLPCKHCHETCPTQQKLDEHIAIANSDSTKATGVFEATKKQQAKEHALSVDEDAQRRYQMRLADDEWALEASSLTPQAEQAARKALSAAIDGLAYRIEKLAESTNTSHNELIRLFSKSVQQQKDIQAAHGQRQKEAMQNELEALDVQAALIAARRKELLAKMRR
jgi:hypothetical protein